MTRRTQFEVDNLLALLLGALFLGTGIAKIASAEFVVATFGGWDHAPWLLTVLGAVEVLAAVLVLIPNSRTVGASILSAVMVGALGYHLLRAEWLLAALPLAILATGLTLLRLERALTRGSVRAFEGEVAPS